MMEGRMEDQDEMLAGSFMDPADLVGATINTANRGDAFVVSFKKVGTLNLGSGSKHMVRFADGAVDEAVLLHRIKSGKPNGGLKFTVVTPPPPNRAEPSSRGSRNGSLISFPVASLSDAAAAAATAEAVSNSGAGAGASPTSAPAIIAAVEFALRDTNDRIRSLAAKVGRIEASAAASSSDLPRAVENDVHKPQPGARWQRALAGAGSMQKKQQGNNQGSTLDPIMIGDLVVFRVAEGAGKGGFLTADSVLRRPGALVIDEEHDHRDPLAFDELTFRIVPMLTYRQQHELDIAQRGADTAHGRASFSRGNGGDRAHGSMAQHARHEQAVMAMLRGRVEEERQHNRALLEKVMRGENSEILVKYGDQIQLQHIKSGWFLVVTDTSAPIDPECRGLLLDPDGSHAALFRFMPRFKAQAERSIVYYTHTLVVESMTQAEMRLHTSSGSYSDFPDIADPKLPKCLQTGKMLEVNLSPRRDVGFTVTKYGRFRGTDADLLRTNTPFRLFHSQTESFLNASCDADKDRRFQLGRNNGREPAHVPYLKKLPDHGEEPDPSDPHNHYPKSIWCFEPQRRQVSTTVVWEQSVRVRHVPSGRYLAVDTSAPCRQEAHETCFSAYLVDDEALEADTDPPVNMAGDKKGFKAIHSDAMLFVANPADAEMGKCIPDEDVNLRLCHVFNDGNGQIMLFLRSIDERKPEKVELEKRDEHHHGHFAHSLRIVFSTVPSAQDIYKLMRVPDQEVRSIALAKQFATHIMTYALALANETVPVRVDMAGGMVRLLLELLKFLINGHVESHGETPSEWLNKATALRPAELAALFSGEPNLATQRISRDMKLMDAIVAANMAPYSRSERQGVAVWSYGEEQKALKPHQTVQKFLHVAIQRLCTSNHENEDYFGRRKLRAYDLSAKPTSISWMSVLLRQQSDGLGAMTTLSKLLSDNTGLMKKFAGPELVHRFLEMISSIGPQPRMMDFFSSICSVEGKAVLSNQEMLLRLTWIDPVVRHRSYVQTRSIAAASIAPQLKLYANVEGATGALSDGRDSTSRQGFPSSYIGKEAFEAPEGLAPCFVQWASLDMWRANNSEGALWWSPKALGIPEYTTTDSSSLRESVGGEHKPSSWVRIEDLCWVLEPDRLCFAVTGKEWIDIENALTADPVLQLRFNNHRQLATYYASQLKYLGRMCSGRSYNCIRLLSEYFPYLTLATMAYNVLLPNSIVAAAISFTRFCYMDRHPQNPNVGHETLPEHLWVYEATKEECTVPQIKPIKLSEPGALPEFVISPDHPCASDPDPFNSFPTHTKFFIFRNLGNLFVKSMINSAGECILVHEDEVNAKSLQVFDVIHALTSYGFQSTEAKLRDLLGNLVKVLDGRTNIERLGFDDEIVPFDPPERRFELTSLSPDVTSLKTTIVRTLETAVDLLSSFRCRQILCVFKKYFQDKAALGELLKIHHLVRENRENEYEGNLEDLLFDDFDSIFNKGDGPQLNLAKLAGDAPLDVILLDCLMYDDDELFSSALRLLETRYGLRGRLMTRLNSVLLLDHDTIPIFVTVDKLVFDVILVHFAASAASTWGVNSQVAGGFNIDQYKELLNICDRLSEFLVTKPIENKADGLGKIAKAENSMGKIMQKLQVARAPKFLEMKTSMSTVKGAEEVSMSTDEEEKVSAATRIPVKLHQDILRSIQFDRVVRSALGMDYNISFRGASESSPADKCKSRAMLLDVQRRLLDVVRLYAKNNTENQHEVFSKELPGLVRHLGPLKDPEWASDVTEEQRRRFIVESGSGLNTEALIVECLEGNADLCEHVHRDLVEEFGDLLEAQDDPSKALHVLDFFKVICLPSGASGKAIPRNQEMCLDVLLSPELSNVSKSFEMAMSRGDGDGQHDLAYPERFIDLFSATLQAHNLRAQAKLQQKGFRLEKTLHRLEQVTNDVLCSFGDAAVPTSTKEDALLKSPIFTSAIGFMRIQMEVSVVDPKLFKDPATWTVLLTGVRFILNAAARNSAALPGKKLIDIALSSCHVGLALLDGIHASGIMEEIEREHHNDLVGNEASVFESAFKVVTASEFRKGQEELRCLASRLCIALKPACGVLVAGDNESIISEDVKSADPLARSSSPGVVSVLTPSTAFVYFREALNANLGIQKIQLSKRFELIRILEKCEAETGPDSKVAGSQGCGAVQITWIGLVKRMVRFVEVHHYDLDRKDDCVRVLRLLGLHLEKARSKEDGTEFDFSDLSAKQRKIYTQKQSSFVDLGVVHIALESIAHHAANQHGNIADEAIKLLDEVLLGGNLSVQNEIISFVSHHDRDNKVLLHFRARIEHALEATKDRQDITHHGFVFMAPDLRTKYEHALKTFEMLQMFCEGHNLDAQNLLRRQSHHAVCVCLLEDASLVFTRFCRTSANLRHMEPIEVHLLKKMLDFFVEATQGPCSGNQEFLVEADAVVSVLDKVLQSAFSSRISSTLRIQVKVAALNVLAATLERRVDLKVHQHLVKEFEPTVFKLLRQNLMSVLEKAQKARHARRGNRHHLHHHHGHHHEAGFNEIEAIVLDAMAAINTITSELDKVPEYLAKERRELELEEQHHHVVQKDLLDQEVTTTEIMWHDRIETVSFPRPRDACFLTAKSKADFLMKMDLTTAEKRMKELFSRAPIFEAEMTQIYRLCQMSKCYAYMHRNIVTIQWCLYALVVFLNINIVMASYGVGRSKGYASIWVGLFVEGAVKPDYTISLYVSAVLAAVNLFGYVVIVAFLAVTEVPIMITRLDAHVEESLERLKEGSMLASEFRNTGAFTSWGVVLLFSVLFIFMHYNNYPGSPNYTLYALLVFGVNLPWALSCARHFVVVPNYPLLRAFCIVYDVLISKPFLRNHVILMFLSGNGFLSSVYFPLMLLDIMNISQQLGNIVRSVGSNGSQLAWVFFLFIVTMIIYAQFGLEYFEDDFVFEGGDDDEDIGCHSVVGCCILIFYRGLPGGSLGDIMSRVDHSSQNFLTRMIFDLSFFVWVGILLFNVITGLMVDGFWSMRAEDSQRQSTLDNSCFVCGFTRANYSDIPHFKGPSFDHHKNITHDYLKYVYFWIYLKRKEKTELSGAETYVWQLICDDLDLRWVPVRNTAAIQAISSKH